MTLVEIVAALAIAGLAVLGGALVIDQLNDQGVRIVRDGAAGARVGNGDRLLHRLFSEAEPSLDSTEQLRGAARSVEFRTRCDSPFGWTEPCQALFAIDSLRDSSDVTVQLSTGESVILARRAGLAEFRYVDLLRADTAWMQRWLGGAVLPSAIAIVTSTDTLLLPVGASRE